MNRSITLFLASFLAGVSAPVLAQTAAFSSLDYTRVTTSGSITFIPLLSSDASYQEGITFYNAFYNDVSEPIALGGGVKFLEVIVLPAVHANEAAEYNQFFENSTRVDKQEFWFGSGSPCGVAAALQPFSEGLPPELQPVVYAAGYPQVCHATIYYRAAQEAALLALLHANRGITVKSTLPLCAPSSPVYRTAPIIRALRDNHTLNDDGEGGLVGSALAVVAELRNFRRYHPTQLSKNGETSLFVDGFAPVGSSDVMLRDGYDDTRFTACNPAPVTISYGD